ncbi:RINT-1 / TIP-1 family [Plasmodiophora brassicae]
MPPGDGCNVLDGWAPGAPVPLSRVLDRKADLLAMASSLRTQLLEKQAEMSALRDKADGVIRRLASGQQSSSTLSEIVNDACSCSADIRPRAQHALQALQSIVAARKYMDAVADVRSAIGALGPVLTAVQGAALNDSTYRLLADRTSDLIDLWGAKRDALGAASLAHVWASARISSMVDKWRTCLERAASNALNEIGWPCTSAGSMLRLSVDVRARTHAQLMLTCLVALQNAFESPDAISAPGSWVLPLLCDPIIVRFKYHFDRESSATNRPDKPEWFLGFISRALAQHVPPLRDDLLPGHDGIVTAFVDRLLSPLKAKLEVLLRELATRTDLSLFQHCVKHVLAFEPCIVDVLTRTPSMRAILLAVERDTALAQLEFILEGLPSPWVTIHSTPLVVTTNSADALLSTLYQITEKTMSRLPILTHRLEFAALQGRLVTVYTQRCEALLELALKDISAAGVRTSATASSDWATFIGIVNSLDCVQSVLDDWSDRVLFVELQFVRGNRDALPNGVTSDDVLALQAFTSNTDSTAFFADECARMSQLIAEFVDLLVEVVVKAFSHAASSYLTRGILPQTSTGGDGEVALSASICDALSTLSTSMNIVSSQLAGRCFRRFWTGVAQGLDNVLYQRMIVDKYITRAGTVQLRADFDAITLLFRAHSEHPAAAMPHMSTSLSLLESPLSRVQDIVNDPVPMGPLSADEVAGLCKRISAAASVET